MTYKNIIKCERCSCAIYCESLNPYICENFSPEINSVSCLDNSLYVNHELSLSLDDKP
jgi:hypothetical protein